MKSSLKCVVRLLIVFSGIILGAWTALAIFYTSELPFLLTILLSLTVAGLYALALFGGRGRWSRKQRAAEVGPQLGVSCLLATVSTMVYYFNFVLPDTNLDWASEHARMPRVKIEGDKIYVKDVRNFRWKTATEYTEGFYDRTYDLSKHRIDALYYWNDSGNRSRRARISFV